MLIAVLVLALLGLWTPIVVALLIFREWELRRLEDSRDAVATAIARHPAGRHREAENWSWICSTCGAHNVDLRGERSH